MLNPSLGISKRMIHVITFTLPDDSPYTTLRSIKSTWSLLFNNLLILSLVLNAVCAPNFCNMFASLYVNGEVNVIK